MSADPPEAGLGLYTAVGFAQFDIIGIYTGGEHLMLSDVLNPRHVSDYVVQYGGLVRDAWDAHAHSVTCHVARANDPLNLDKANADWYIHPHYPTLLLVLATKSLPPHTPVLISYGGDYWCRPDTPVHTLQKAIQCYHIDITTRGDWQALPQYAQLCTLIHASTSLPPTTAGAAAPSLVRVKGGYFGTEPRQLSLTHFWQVLSHRRQAVLPSPTKTEGQHSSLMAAGLSTNNVPTSPAPRKRRRQVTSLRARKRCARTAEDRSLKIGTRAAMPPDSEAAVSTACRDAWDSSVTDLNLTALKAIFSVSDVSLPVPYAFCFSCPVPLDQSTPSITNVATDKTTDTARTANHTTNTNRMSLPHDPRFVNVLPYDKHVVDS